MGQSIDMSGDDLYVNAVYAGNATPGKLSTTASPTAAYVKYITTGVNFNTATTDNAIVINLPAGAKNYKINGVQITNASGTLTTATAGLFTTAGGTGTIAADQAITVTSGTANTALNTQGLTLSAASTTAFSFGTLFFRIGTPQGVAATADVTLFLAVYS